MIIDIKAKDMIQAEGIIDSIPGSLNGSEDSNMSDHFTNWAVNGDKDLNSTIMSK